MKTRSLLIVLLTALLLASCASAVPAAPTPTATATDRPTVTNGPTVTPRPTATDSDPFAVTTEKLSHNPPDYDYLVNHLDEFVQAPDPWVYGVDEFNRWIDEYLDPVLGPMPQRQPNVLIDYSSGGSETNDFSVSHDPQLLIGNMDFFYFTGNGVVYPVYILNGQKRGTEGINMSMGVALMDGIGNDGLDTVRIISEGKFIFMGATIDHSFNPALSYLENSLISAGFGSVDRNVAPRRTRIGFGAINFVP